MAGAFAQRMLFCGIPEVAGLHDLPFRLPVDRVAFVRISVKYSTSQYM